MMDRRNMRPQMTPELALWLCCVFFVLLCNRSYWSALLQHRDMQWKDLAFVLVHGSGLCALFFLVLGLLTPRRWFKPVMAACFLFTAIAVYYIERYRVYLDPSMLRNVIQTDPHEAKELITASLLLKTLVLGVLPAAALWTLRLTSAASTSKAVLRRFMHLVLAACLLVASLLAYFADLSSFHRNHREARFLITPANYLYSLVQAVRTNGSSTSATRMPLGTDARLRITNPITGKPPLVVVVVGETARAANFQLNGYARPTNPRLAELEVINFPQVRSCGTATATSLPCMFSHLGRKEFSDDQAGKFDSILHILARAGMRVVWRDNQSGCKGVCDGLTFDDVSGLNVADLCKQGRCFDEILLHDFEKLTAQVQPTVLVLHQLGSHGPAYFARYPQAFARFVPECKEADLRLCTKAEIANAYDNTILYTDHLLASLIERLKSDKRYATAMIYLSDHGESLGEGGLYLHGLPYAIAPQVQTHVPMIMWLSDAFRTNANLNLSCLKSQGLNQYSHDNLFHSLLGLLSIDTKVYDRALDIFQPCLGPLTRP